MGKNKTGKYLKYAAGEIILVVIGILIALQINNWNENKKQLKYEHYILREIRNNLTTEEEQIQEILSQRERTQKSINSMLIYLNTQEIDKSIYASDLAQVLTFERYFPVRTAYEISKSNRVPISNPELRTQIANYYEFEQYKTQSSIKDIENVFLNKFEGSYEKYVSIIEFGREIEFIDYPNQELNQWVLNELIALRTNNFETTKRVGTFSVINKSLLELVNNELQKVENK